MVGGGGKSVWGRLAQIFKLRSERAALFPSSPHHLDIFKVTYFMFIYFLDYFNTLLVPKMYIKRQKIHQNCGWCDPAGSPRVRLGFSGQPGPDPGRVWVQNPAGLPEPE